jgi:DNA-binding transcriptional ArsR family regulator
MSECDLLCLDLPKAEVVRQALPPIGQLETWAATAKALSDPTRLSVALALAGSGSACGCDVAWIVGKEDKLVSHHLRALRAAGAATSRRDGKMVMYELTATGSALLSALTVDQGAAA